MVVVPRKEETFDHNREYTSFEHILTDYKDCISEKDLTHLPEILEKHDYRMDLNIDPEQFRIRAEHNYENRGLHHHVFDMETLKKMFEYIGLLNHRVFRYERNYVIIASK